MTYYQQTHTCIPHRGRSSRNWLIPGDTETCFLLCAMEATRKQNESKTEATMKHGIFHGDFSRTPEAEANVRITEASMETRRPPFLLLPAGTEANGRMTKHGPHRSNTNRAQNRAQNLSTPSGFIHPFRIHPPLQDLPSICCSPRGSIEKMRIDEARHFSSQLDPLLFLFDPTSRFWGR